MTTRIALLALSTVLLSACGGGAVPLAPPLPADPSGAPPNGKLQLRKLDGPQACPALAAYLGESLTEQLLAPYRCLGFGPCAVLATDPLASPPPAATDGAEGGGSGGPDRVSETPLQEAGVDEADLIKVDREGRLYTLRGSFLRVLEAFPPENLAEAALTELDLAGDVGGRFTALSLFLDTPEGGTPRAAVLGRRDLDAEIRSETVLVDLSDAQAPRVIGRVAVEGWPLDARRVGERVHRVARFDPRLPPTLFNDDTVQRQRETYFQALSAGDAAAAEAARQAVRARVDALVAETGVSPLLPRRYDGATARPIACSDVAYPEVATGLGLAVLQSFDLDGGAQAVSAVVNNAYLVYVSPENLYLAQNSQGWFFAPDQPDETVIYRFALSDTAAPEYRGEGRVPGTPPHRFALSEHAGHLRVATTAFDWMNPEARSLNHLHVLQLTSTGLPVVGALQGFAPNESTRGVRFMGDRGFVVTFEQIDPLFGFDLRNPRSPRLLGELKIPGFSSYLLPLGTDHLLTIGRGGDETQLNGRMAVQLFDVADLANLQLQAVLEPEIADGAYSYSPAEYEPLAFTYFPDRDDAPVPGLLAIPLQVSGGGRDFSGFIVLRVDPAAPQPLMEWGRVDHVRFDGPGDCGAGDPSGAAPDSDAQSVPACRGGSGVSFPLRTLFMEDAVGRYLYTYSTGGLVAVDADAPATLLGQRALPAQEDVSCCEGPVAEGPAQTD